MGRVVKAKTNNINICLIISSIFITNKTHSDKSFSLRQEEKGKREEKER